MIPIKNIYYMLSYAFKALKAQGYKKLSNEDFENTADLCSAILIRGLKTQLKRGLNRDYLPKMGTTSFVRGKIDIAKSVKTQSIQKNRLVCSYDDFSANSYLNRIIKSTLQLLLKADIAQKRKKELRKLLVYFKDIDSIDFSTVNWNFRFNRNNQNYQLLIEICRLVVKDLLQTQSDGTAKLMDFIDEQNMHRLYEKFILEYYRREFPQIKVEASQIPWQLDDGFGPMLPVMQSDITLSYKDKVLIIDAKYYSHTTQNRFDKHTIHSGNLYQIYTYVKNKQAQLSKQAKNVSGMLLYARSDEIVQPDNDYLMGGNQISVKTLDLNTDFSEIADQLDQIVFSHFGIRKN